MFWIFHQDSVHLIYCKYFDDTFVLNFISKNDSYNKFSSYVYVTNY